MERYEKEFTKFVETICFQDDVPLLNPDTEFRENYHEEIMSAQEYTGYAAILGPWMIHMFEAESPLMQKFLFELNKTRE